MPIDPSIYNMVGKFPQIEVPDPLERQTRLAQLKQLASQGQMTDMAMADAQAKRAREARAKELLTKNQGDVQKAAQEAAAAGDYETASEFQTLIKTDAVYQKSVSEAQEAFLKASKEERAAVQAGLEDLAKGIQWVEQGNPEELPARYARFVQHYPPQVREKYGMGPQYDPSIGGLIKARAQAWGDVSKSGGTPASAVGKIMEDYKRGFYGTGPEAIRLRDAAIKDATTKQPAVQVGLGGVESGVDAEGNPVFFQPRKAGGAAEVIPNVKPAPKADAKRKEDPGTAAAILDEAEKLVKVAPGSLIGAGGALVQRGVGVSTKASQAQAQLNALQASLMMRMPRMEGPQSDKDVALYREQAGRIADPTIPAGDKIAAIKSIRNIVTKYAAKPTTQAKPATKVNPSDGKTYYLHSDGKYYSEKG